MTAMFLLYSSFLNTSAYICPLCVGCDREKYSVSLDNKFSERGKMYLGKPSKGDSSAPGPDLEDETLKFASTP